MNATPEVLPQTPVPAAAPGARRRSPLLIGALVVLLLFTITYLVAWLRARSLTQEYLGYAGQRYQQGKYLEALVGYQEFDEQRQRYISRGGYFQVQRIWANRYAWPKPPGVTAADERIDEIINQKITIEDAEQFIQASSGRGNPYLGIIYLRLGELYEQEGSTRDARDIYESIAELFPNEPQLIERAQQHLQTLK